MNLEKSLLKNWLTLLGLVLSLGALFIFILLFIADLFFGHTSPYFNLLTYVCIPSVLGAGIALIILGLLLNFFLQNYQKGSGKFCPCSYLKATKPKLTLDFSRGSFWGSLICLLVILGLIGSVAAIAGYKVYHWTEDDEFCGELCHTPMKPENVAHQFSPHAKIKCVECHVGPGIEAYTYAKINGIRQLAQTLTKTWNTPIHVPVSAMYARHLDGKTKIEHTCLECHYQEDYIGSKEKVFTHFLKNEEDLKTQTRMILNVGGGNPDDGFIGGIHWHASKGSKIEFATDDNKRNGEIMWVRMTTTSITNIYTVSNFKMDETKHEIFTMSCLDCHNRPAHRYVSPVTAVDLAMEVGTLPTDLGDSVKYVVVDLLTAPYETEEEALKAIEEGMQEYFDGSEYLESATKTVQTIYKRNIFPEMKASWEAYPDYIGHKETLGCARCHNSELTSETDGEAIRNGCQDCHQITHQFKEGEWDETDLKGLTFYHPDGNDQEDITTCSKCHNGTY